MCPLGPLLFGGHSQVDKPNFILLPRGHLKLPLRSSQTPPQGSSFPLHPLYVTHLHPLLGQTPSLVRQPIGSWLLPGNTLTPGSRIPAGSCWLQGQTLTPRLAPPSLAPGHSALLLPIFLLDTSCPSRPRTSVHSQPPFHPTAGFSRVYVTGMTLSLW